MANRPRPLVDQIRRHSHTDVWKTLVRFRHGERCGICGTIRWLSVDHIIPLEALLHAYCITTLEEGLLCNALFDVDNGRVLCRRCHSTWTKTWRKGAFDISPGLEAQLKQLFAIDRDAALRQLMAMTQPKLDRMHLSVMYRRAEPQEYTIP